MPVVNSTVLSLADVYKRKGEDGQKIAKIIEVLDRTNPMVSDAPAFECNKGSSHLTTLRTGLPAPTWRVLNRGVGRTKSRTGQIEDTTGFMEAWSEVDAELLKLSGDPDGLRLSEATPHIEGMNQEAEASIFYADTNSAPNEILGLAPRYSSLSATNGDQIIDCGGTGSDNTSIWFVVWGEDTAHLIYPKGTMAGLDQEDLGEETAYDEDNNPYRVKREKFTWHLGLTVRNYKAVCRLANIDVSNLTTDASGSSADIIEQMVNGYHQVRRLLRGRRGVVYVPPVILRFLDHQSRQAPNKLLLNWREAGPESQMMLNFRNMPIRESDGISENEARVV